MLDGDVPQYTGIGIQENGMYCRSNGDEAGCINPGKEKIFLFCCDKEIAYTHYFKLP